MPCQGTKPHPDHYRRGKPPESRVVRVFNSLAAVMPPPDEVTRQGILAGDRKMLDRWWEELGLHSASWWRMWKGLAPQVR